MESGVAQLNNKIQHQTVEMEQKIRNKMAQAQELSELAKQYEDKQSIFDQDIDTRKQSL